MEQETVETPVETTTPAESVPAETQTIDAQPASADTSVEPEKKVSESVPYDRFKEVNDRQNDPEFIKQRAMELGLIQPQPEAYTPSGASDEVPFDEDTMKGLDSVLSTKLRRELEVRDAQQFVKIHAEDLKDPIVDARTKDLIRQGVDREQALQQAKQELNSRIAPQVKEAQANGVKEGQILANKKEAMGAVGLPGSTDKVDPEKLSAAEYAKYYGLPRV